MLPRKERDDDAKNTVITMAGVRAWTAKNRWRKKRPQEGNSRRWRFPLPSP